MCVYKIGNEILFYVQHFMYTLNLLVMLCKIYVFFILKPDVSQSFPDQRNIAAEGAAKLKWHH